MMARRLQNKRCLTKERLAMFDLFRTPETTAHTLCAPLDALVPERLSSATFGVG